MALHRSEDEFWADFRTFNGFFDPCRWQETKAAKGHVDEFGQVIAERDVYFTRTLGLGSNERLKVSRASMEALLSIFFLDNPAANELGELIIQERHKRMADVMERVSAQLKGAQHSSLTIDGISDGT
jgi:hypothetical protein